MDAAEKLLLGVFTGAADRRPFRERRERRVHGAGRALDHQHVVRGRPAPDRALGIYTAAAAGGFTFGLVSGGLLTELSRRYTFAVVVPAALVLLLAALSVVHADASAPRRGRLDVWGALTVTGAALLFVWPVVEAPASGWLSIRTGAGLAAAAVLLGAFVAIERTVEQPLVRLALLRSAPLVRANLGALLLFGCATVFNVANTLYEQNALGWSPLKTGIVFMVARITTGALAPCVGAIGTRIGTKRVLLLGGLASLASYAL